MNVREPRLAPFRALRYAESRVGSLGAVLAPPYDVIGPEEARELRARHEKNAVRVTLPEGETPERYAEAARTLEGWIDEGTLVRDAEPMIYIHRHRFIQDGAERARTGIWALIRLVPFEAGIVLPHERTMKGPKADRLALMTACRAQLSPIFFICSDPHGRFAELVSELSADQPWQNAEFPTGTEHEIWRVADPEILAELSGALADQVFLIADGHHRYETALAYRDRLIEAGAPKSGAGGHNYLLAYVVSERDDGLSLEPTHRVMVGNGADWEAAVEAADDRFRVRRVSEAELGDVGRLLEGHAESASFVLVVRGLEGAWLLEPARGGETDIPSVALHEYFLDRVSGWSAEEPEAGLRFERQAEQAVREVRSGRAAAAALLAPSRVAQIREAARAGRRLPPKTTYFQPKVPTGIAFHRVDPGEAIGLP